MVLQPFTEDHKRSGAASETLPANPTERWSIDFTRVCWLADKVMFRARALTDNEMLGSIDPFFPLLVTMHSSFA